MKYKAIEILKNIDRTLRLSYYDLPLDREDMGIILDNACRFMYYPATMSDEEGLNCIKEKFIARHLETIENLKKEIEMVKKFRITQ